MTIAALKQGAARSRSTQLPAGALRDLRETLRFNARQTHLTRITTGAFREHLRKDYGLSVSQCTLARIVRGLGKLWSGENVG